MRLSHEARSDDRVGADLQDIVQALLSDRAHVSAVRDKTVGLRVQFEQQRKSLSLVQLLRQTALPARRVAQCNPPVETGDEVAINKRQSEDLARAGDGRGTASQRGLLHLWIRAAEGSCTGQFFAGNAVRLQAKIGLSWT